MTIVISALLAICVASMLPRDSNERIQQLIQTYGDIEYSHEYPTFYRSLFAACKECDLEKLHTNRNSSIATQSAWESVTLTVPEEDGPGVYRPDSKKLSWFIGFFEGRNTVVAPDWWREVVADARAHRRNNIYPGEPNSNPYHRSGIEWVRCPVNASVDEKNKTVTYTLGDDSIVVPEELLNRADSGELWCNVSGCFTEYHCFIAVHDDVGFSHVVACVDRKTDKVVWKSHACGCWWGIATGQHQSWVSVVPTSDGRVFVFGAASTGFYAHGFDAATGKTLVQFSSNY